METVWSTTSTNPNTKHVLQTFKTLNNLIYHYNNHAKKIKHKIWYGQTEHKFLCTKG